MSDYPMLISNKLHSFRNFGAQRYKKEKTKKNALITYQMYQRIFYNILISFLVQLYKQFAFNFLSRNFVFSQ